MRAEPDLVVGRRVHRGAVHQRVRNARRAQDLDRRRDALNVVHAGAENHRLAETGDVPDERIVVALAGTDLVRRHVHSLEPIGGRARERRRQVDQPASLGVGLQRAARRRSVQRAPRHDVPDALGRVARDHVVRDHLVVDDVALELHALAPRLGGVVDHAASPSPDPLRG